uniref:DUF3786 domain-containing protein n=1 Tax=Desulfobacca acetoxidans TaxID=60893 RepID=A0A7C5ALC0_9BACT
MDQMVPVGNEKIGAMPLTVMEVLKTLPLTNCGDCGQATCLAFATRVIKEGEDFSRCPHLTESARALAGKIGAQQASGVGRRRESLAIALEALQEKVAPLDLAELAEGLGARYGEQDGCAYLDLTYFGQPLRIFKDRVCYPEGVQGNPWDAILIYNYVASRGREPLRGQWITFQSLPNSVSKTKTLKRLERELADHFARKGEELLARATNLGAQPTRAAEDADLQLVFQPLPKVPVLLLFWEAEWEEDFPAQVHFLFDGSVSHYLDLESLLFLVEQLTDRLKA